MVILMKKDEKRLMVVQRVMDGKMDVSEASLGLGLSSRQFYRVMEKVRSAGAAGVGNQHALKYKEAFNKKLLDRVRKSYLDINDRQLVELLQEKEKIKITREKLRLLLRKNGFGPKHKRRSKQYRSRRDRKANFGAMIQMDASTHDWLEGRGPKMSLVGGVDDATSYAWARFEETENTWGYLRVLQEIITKEGVPLSIYTDRHTLFHSPKEPSIIEQFQNIRSLTQVGRACRDLGIEMIKAYSPQAKGRIERL